MANKKRAVREIYRGDETNPFFKCKTMNRLIKYYHQYVEENGTSAWLNDQYQKRLSELELQHFICQEREKQLLAGRTKPSRSSVRYREGFG